jgi:hypothetical protein
MKLRLDTAILPGWEALSANARLRTHVNLRCFQDKARQVYVRSMAALLEGTWNVVEN